MGRRIIWIKGFLVRGRSLNLPNRARMGELVRTGWCIIQDGEWEYQRGKRWAHSQSKLGDGKKREPIWKPCPGALPCMAPPAVTPHHWSTIYTVHTFQRNPLPRLWGGLLGESQSTHSSLTSWNSSYPRGLNQSFKLPKLSCIVTNQCQWSLNPFVYKKARW